MTTITRPTETICPPWCAGHRDAYQSWEPLADGSGQIRDHDSHIEEFGAVEVALGQREGTDHNLESPVVRVYVVDDDADLTEAQAHELGMALVRAADVLRHARMEAQR